jgi:hypothetical protein
VVVTINLNPSSVKPSPVYKLLSNLVGKSTVFQYPKEGISLARIPVYLVFLFHRKLQFQDRFLTDLEFMAIQGQDSNDCTTDSCPWILETLFPNSFGTMENIVSSKVAKQKS